LLDVETIREILKSFKRPPAEDMTYIEKKVYSFEGRFIALLRSYYLAIPFFGFILDGFESLK
jgi:hypothetical protein